MIDIHPKRAALSFDGKTVSMAQDGWRLTTQATELSGWIALHEEMAVCLNGKCARFYVQPVVALKAAQVRLAMKEGQSRHILCRLSDKTRTC